MANTTRPRARANPFLFQLVLKQFQRVLKRLAYFYASLASLPRKKRRALQRALATSLIGAALLLALSGAPVVHAANIIVGGGCTLADAITAANTDTATGGCIAGDPGADTITLTTNITLGATLPDITSVITLEGNNFYVDGANAFRVFRVTSTGDFTINKTTIQDGYYYGNGGAIFNNGTLTITNSTLSGNDAGTDAGAIYNNGVATITNSTLSGNDADDEGGAIENDGILTITNSTLSGNTAGTDAGAIDNDYPATLTITNSTLSGNTAGTDGGAIDNGLYATTTLNRTLISGNTATGNGDEIYNYSGT